MSRTRGAAMRRASMVASALTAVILLLAGCTGLRERAEQAQAELDRVETMAETASQGAARNAGSIRALADRMDALEADVARLGAELEALKAQERDGPRGADGELDAELFGEED